MSSSAARDTFVVGTRDSILARLQTDLALAKIRACFPNYEFKIEAVKTSGDKILNAPLAELGGRGVFVKELEESLLAGDVDFVIHSLKDLPTDLPDRLCLGATFDRADPRDVLVSRNGTTLGELPAGSRIATSSRRRAAQLSAIRKDLQFVDIRGNIQTRMRKLDEGQCDAMVLAAAGLIRLGLSERIAQFFDEEESTPAVGQGVLGIECRNDDELVLLILDKVNEPLLRACVDAERAFLHELGGGCSVPVGALAKMTSANELELKACVASLDGQHVYKGTARGGMDKAQLIGFNLAEQLKSEGAGEVILALLKTAAGPVSPP